MPLSGFPELLPAQRAVEQHVLDVLREAFELHGFAGIETRGLEPLSVLLGKGEIDKEVYTVSRLHEDPTATSDGDPADRLALHFDLTVPFARYVLENAGHLTFPFRRYQIQKVWRGERPQEGRYREFTQADIDVVDRDVLAPHHDAEMARVMGSALARLPIPPVTLQVNDRRLVEGFYRALGLDDDAVAATLRGVDKLDKIGVAGVGSLLADAGLTDTQVSAALALSQVRVDAEDATTLADAVGALGVSGDLLAEGVASLTAVLAGCRSVAPGRVRVVADLSIARGLDYYTGTVYETRLDGYASLGSICSGGRYDSLASDGRSTYPGVGISLGVTRLLAPLLGRGVLTASRPTPTAVLVAVADEEHRGQADALAAQLRARGVATEVSPTAAKFGRQIRFADRRGIPFVWFPGSGGAGAGDPDAGDAVEGAAGRGHEVKDIRSGEQVPADPSTWLPPAADARPAVVGTW